MTTTARITDDPAIILVHKEREKRISSERLSRKEIQEMEWFIMSFYGKIIDAAHYAKISRPTFYAVRARRSGRPDTIRILRSAIAARKQEKKIKDLFDLT